MNHVPNVNTNSELRFLPLVRERLLFLQRSLDVNGADSSIEGIGELYEERVSDRLDLASAVSFEDRPEDLLLNATAQNKKACQYSRFSSG